MFSQVGVKACFLLHEIVEAGVDFDELLALELELLLQLDLVVLLLDHALILMVIHEQMNGRVDEGGVLSDQVIVVGSVNGRVVIEVLLSRAYDIVDRFGRKYPR